jgi:hypothetical protein
MSNVTPHVAPQYSFNNNLVFSIKVVLRLISAQWVLTCACITGAGRTG